MHNLAFSSKINGYTLGVLLKDKVIRLLDGYARDPFIEPISIDGISISLSFLFKMSALALFACCINLLHKLLVAVTLEHFYLE